MATKSTKVKAIVRPDRIDVITDKKVKEDTHEASLKQVQPQVKELVAQIDGLDSAASVEALITKDPDKLAESYSALRTVANIIPIELSKVNDIIKEHIEDTDEPVVSERHEVQWTLSEKKFKVEYDLDGLKKDHPEVYRKVNVRNGKPMKKADRQALDDKVADLEAQLAKLREQQVADDVAASYSLNESALDALAATDEEIAKYRIVSQNPRKFYFKNLKNEK